MKISLGSWAFSFGPFADNPIPFEKTVKRLSEAGYDGIEICGFPPHVTLDQYPNKESRQKLVRFLQDNRLGVSGYAADFTSVNPVVADNKQKYLDLFKRNTEMCVDIGSPCIRVDSIAAPGSIEDRDYRAAFDRLADVWRDSAGIAQAAGIRLVWEFEPGFAFNKPSEVVSMHQTVGVEEFLGKLKGRIGAIHLIDSDGTLHGDETSTHRPFGEGFVDFRTLAPKLLDVPKIEWWCIDMCFWAGSWELVEPSLKFVRKLLSTHAVVG